MNSFYLLTQPITYSELRNHIASLSLSQLRPSNYAICFLSSFIISFLFIFFFLKRKGLPGSIIGYSILLSVCLILYGSKLYTVIASGFRLTIFTAGTSSLGGAIGLLISILLFCKIYPWGKSYIWSAYTMSLPLLYSISKIGCHLAGCCHGISYNGPLNISYDNEVAKVSNVFPIQLTESIVFFFIFCLGLFAYHKLFWDNTQSLIAFIILLCAVCKFSLEYLRQEHVGVFLSMNQFVCIAFFILGLVLYTQKKHIRS